MRRRSRSGDCDAPRFVARIGLGVGQNISSSRSSSPSPTSGREPCSSELMRKASVLTVGASNTARSEMRTPKISWILAIMRVAKQGMTAELKEIRVSVDLCNAEQLRPDFGQREFGRRTARGFRCCFRGRLAQRTRLACRPILDDSAAVVARWAASTRL